MVTNLRLGYLASGSGSSVESLAKKIIDRELKGYTSAIILCNKPAGQAGVYDRGANLGIPVIHVTSTEQMIDLLKHKSVDLVLGLGYVKLVEPSLLDAFTDRVLNIHPTLLPRHGGKGMYGLETHMSVLRSGDTHTGPTVHLMNEDFDKGRILQQNMIDVPSHLVGRASDENAKVLQKVVLQEEYKIMPQVLEKILKGNIRIGL